MNTEPLIYQLMTEFSPALAEVGGKALSLMQMTEAGFPVPPGFVLTTRFFAPWFAQLNHSGTWQAVLDSPPEQRKTACATAKAEAVTYAYTAEQRDVLAQATTTLLEAEAPLFAVRSSSPEEDLEGASFAGGYETLLGVTAAQLPEAVRQAFLSCLDERIYAYKQAHGFDVTQPRIAVIVQVQLAAEVAGVAFSLNPLNNCYDEVVINANFGLGESVVSGAVTPDSFVVDRVSDTILSREIGPKTTAVHLLPDGGTQIATPAQPDKPALSEAQVLEVTRLTSNVEASFGKPIDIEWAYADQQLYLLQARPITAWYPLPESMITPPGAPKRLYGDKTLLKQGINEPLSVMGTDFLAVSDTALGKFLGGGNPGSDIVNGLGHTFDGRMYLNISNNMKLQGYNRVVREYSAMDVGASEILANIDKEEYIPKELPANLKGTLWRAAWRNIKPLAKFFKAARQPEVFKGNVAREVADMKWEIRQLFADEARSFRELAERAMDRYLGYMDEGMASLAVSELARLRLKRILDKEPPELRQKMVYLERALPENVTIEMGLAMTRLASFPEIMANHSGAEFARQLAAGQLSADFQKAWDTFMLTYGFRCPLEMDIATPRYAEQPETFFEQLRDMAEISQSENSPEHVFERSRQERETVFAELHAHIEQGSPRRARTFGKLYKNLVDYGGLRESHKYHYIWLLNQLRQRVRRAAEGLVANGRLDTPQQVFDLTLAQLDQGLADPTLDLRALAHENTAYLRRLATVRDFPRIFDSRGKILRPPPQPMQDGELVGQPISPGIVQGRVNILHSPDEKPVEPGDILVARATDPGWTPLFTNAAAILLEVGGILQHGSLVAREYGKPCVAGIDNITHLLEDGQLIEVDGLQGTVRILEEEQEDEHDFEPLVVA